MSLDALKQHMAGGATTVCRAWRVARRDGVVMGFTDHDLDLVIDGETYSARSGLSARSLQQATGLSVDNTEAVGALSDAAVREEDILRGLYDDAEVTAYLVNWQDSSQRSVLFRGSFGEIQREKGAFRVELRGLTERLNQPVGRAYVPTCGARLGDAQCQVDLALPGRVVEGTIRALDTARSFLVEIPLTLGVGWFEQGVLVFAGGSNAGQPFAVRLDTSEAGARRIVLDRTPNPAPTVGERVLLTVGCDRRVATCRDKFQNILNFQGFPHIPGDDWLRRFPSSGGSGGNSGTGAFSGWTQS